MHGSHHRAGSGLSSATAAGAHKSRLRWALFLTLGYMAAEIVAGLVTGSLALLADAAHMMTDAGGLALALFAIDFAAKPATPQMTYGYLRAEILSALVNAVILLLVTVYILFEAYRRFTAPPPVLGTPMLVVAVVGLAVNLASMRILAAGAQESLNVKSAYFEVLSDMLGSGGVILAAIVLLATGWTFVDPLVGAGIGLFIIPRTWRLLREAAHILLEGVPAQVDLDLLTRALRQIPGVNDVHDLHVWTITSGFNAMSGHLVVTDIAEGPRILRHAQILMKDCFGLNHATVQIEAEDTDACGRDCIR
jgi:cobalt-zinc-cadmium efflux system protein